MTLYMPLFRSCTSLRTLTQLHTHLLISGLNEDPLASTKLIESYSQMGTLQSSRVVFETFQRPDSFMWGVLIKCYVWNQFFEQAISFYHRMTREQVKATSFIFPSVLRACSGFGDLRVGREVHGRIIKDGFDTDSVIETSLMNMYGEIGCLSDALKVFDEMSVRDVVSWSSIISSCVDYGEVNEGLEMFRSMINEDVEPDSVTMLSVAEACGGVGLLKLARSVHGYTLRRNSIVSYGSLDNALTVMYSKCGDLHSAEKVFVNISNRSTTSWTSMISSYNRSGWFREALQVFSEMLNSREEFNSVTMMAVIGSCTGLGLLREGKSVHCFVIKRGVELEYDFLEPTLIKLYAECGKLGYSKKILDTVGQQNIVSTNMLISVYVQKGLFEEALILFTDMHSQGLVPDSYTLASSLSACGDAGLIQLGHQIHALVIKRNLWDEFVQNSLIDMYAKNGLLDSASMIFNKIQHKTVVTWNSMISGFSQNGYSSEAIRLFDQMYLNCLEMNKVTFISVIQACANWGYLEKGKCIHHKLITHGIEKDLYIDTALTDMYAKCGDLTRAEKMFNTTLEKNVVSWSTMIAGYGIHGKVGSAISLFDCMVKSGIKPNEITFMNVLSACSHGGFVQKGKFYFQSMIDFEIKPNSEHHACMVDLLSRAGDLNGAYRHIKSMQFPADASIWGALLNGCRIHQRADMIKMIERDLLDVRTDDTGFYTLLSNIHAGEGNWGKAKKVRSLMNGGLKKVPGYSTIELDKSVHKFVAGELSQSLPQEMYRFLENFQILASFDVGDSNLFANNSGFSVQIGVRVSAEN